MEAVKFRNFISQHPKLLTLYTSVLFLLCLVFEKKKTTFASCFQIETFSIVGFRLFLPNIRSVTGRSL